jgi:hypothetical protein
MEINEEQLLVLVKAVFAAGFRIGYDNGSDNCSAFEHGSHRREVSIPKDAWKEDVEPDLNPDSYSHLDIKDPKSWENIY